MNGVYGGIYIFIGMMLIWFCIWNELKFLVMYLGSIMRNVTFNLTAWDNFVAWAAGATGTVVFLIGVRFLFLP